MVKRLNFNVTYKGKTYHRVADFARDAGVDTSLVLGRFKRGWTDPEKLAQPPLKKWQWKAPYKVTYQGIEYASLTEFARQFNLSYPKLTRLWGKGIKDPAVLVKAAKPQDDKAAFKEMKSLDAQAKKQLLKSKKLLSIADVASATGVPYKALLKTISSFIRTDSKRTKSDSSAIGLVRDDIVLLPSDQEAPSISNVVAIPNYGLKPSSIVHIKAKADYVRSLDLVKIPAFSHYFYSFKAQEVWSDFDGLYRQVKPRKTKSSDSNQKFSLHKNQQKYEFTVANLEDYLRHPDIKYQDLISIADLCKICKVSKSFWYNGHLNRVFPISHTRYDLGQTKRVKRGYTKTDLINAFKKHEKTKKFVPVLKDIK